MSPELHNAAAEATAEKAEAWGKFTDAAFHWVHDADWNDPAAMRALADAACEYADKRVQRHVDAAVQVEREACAAASDAEAKHAKGDDGWANTCEHIAMVIRARGQTSEAKSVKAVVADVHARLGRKYDKPHAAATLPLHLQARTRPVESHSVRGGAEGLGRQASDGCAHHDSHRAGHAVRDSRRRAAAEGEEAMKLARCPVTTCRRIVWPPWGPAHLCAKHLALWREREAKR